MRQTYSQRILNFLVAEENKNGKAVFNSRIARKRFRSVKNIDGTVMRTARELASKNLLRRVYPGEYVLTAKGRKSAQ